MIDKYMYMSLVNNARLSPSVIPGMPQESRPLLAFSENLDSRLRGNDRKGCKYALFTKLVYIR